MNKLRVIAAQINLLVGDIEGNASRVIQEARKAQVKHNGDLVVFPELTLSGYPPEDLLFRLDFHYRCEQALTHICEATAELDIVLAVGHPQLIDNRIYNQLAIIEHGRIIARYAKQHLPNYTVFDEKRYFHPGGSPCVVTLKQIPIGFLICEDIWHPEPAQQAVSAGACLLVIMNASPFDRNQVLARETVLIERARDLQTPLIYVNLIGGQDELIFDGGSMVIDAKAQHCQQAPYFQEILMPVEVAHDIENRACPVYIEPKPLPSRASEEEQIYQALVLGVRDYIQKNHFPGAIIGLSGGIDSALMAAIAVDALESSQVTTVMMPSRYTSEMSLDDAELQAKNLGVRHLVIPIDHIFQAFLNHLAEIFADQHLDTTEENLQARIRGTLLMALSNKFGSIVLATGNKSEFAVGYATLYGDMAGGFAAIKDIPKTMIYRLAEYRNTLSSVIPLRIIQRPPSAELAMNQLDQDTLPPYPILDQILHLYIELDQSPEFIYETGIDKITVDRIIKMINRNEYKRRQAPIGIRTTQRAFGKDRRYPITSGYIRHL